jgi:hypothetical protein
MAQVISRFSSLSGKPYLMRLLDPRFYSPLIGVFFACRSCKSLRIQALKRFWN